MSQLTNLNLPNQKNPTRQQRNQPSPKSLKSRQNPRRRSQQKLKRNLQSQKTSQQRQKTNLQSQKKLPKRKSPRKRRKNNLRPTNPSIFKINRGMFTKRSCNLISTNATTETHEIHITFIVFGALSNVFGH
jgi:hypothetical protein